MPRFTWTKELKSDGEINWRYHDSQTNQTGLLRDMGLISTDISWPAWLDWKEQYGADYPDPMTEFLKEARMYPGEYVKELAEKIHREGLKLPPRRWLWLRFEYSMLVNPMHPAGLHPFDKVTYDSLLQGTFVVDRDKLYTKFWLWLTLITFRIYMKIPGTQYQDWKQQRIQQLQKNEELRHKQLQRLSNK